MNKNILIIFITYFLFSSLVAQSVTGKWKTIDDNTGDVKSVVEIYEDEGKIYGKIIKLTNPKLKNATCIECKGEKKDEPIIGMVFIEDLSKNDDVYEGGRITNPENGKSYKCRIKLEDSDTLQVRGYLAFFYRTQYWKRIK